MEEKTVSKKSYTLPIVLILLILAVLVGAWYWWKGKEKEIIITPPLPPPTSPTQPQTPPEQPSEKLPLKEDSIATINQDLDQIFFLDLEKEFQEIDQDLNSL